MNTQRPEATEYNAYEALRAAQMAADKAEQARSRMWDSAVLACRAAESQFNKGDWRCARDRALDSLAYSVGKFSPVYQACADRGPYR